MKEIHNSSTCDRHCKVHWYFDFKSHRPRRYPEMAFYQIGPPIDGRKQWSGNIPVFCGPPAYKPEKPKEIEKEKEAVMGTVARGITTALFNYMQEHANKIVTIDQLDEHFKDRFDHLQIMGNMANLMKKPVGKQIERMQTGMWRFNSEEKEEQVEEKVETNPTLAAGKGQLFEKLRDLSEGWILQIGEDGKLYRAREIPL